MDRSINKRTKWNHHTWLCNSDNCTIFTSVMEKKIAVVDIKICDLEMLRERSLVTSICRMSLPRHPSIHVLVVACMDISVF